MNDPTHHPAPRRPRLFYGYIMLAVAIGMALASMPAQTVLVGLWKEPARESLGLSLAAASAAYSAATILAALPLPFVGRAADRFGLRRTVAAVALLLVATLLLTPYAAGILTLAAAFFLLRFLGQGSLGLLAGHVVAMWFERKLGRAHALLVVGGFAAGSALTPIPTAWILDEFGWRTAMLVFAAAVALLTLPAAALLFRNRPEDIGQHLDGDPVEHAHHDTVHGGPPPPGDPAFTAQQAVRTPAYWILLLNMAAAGFIGTALLFHMAPMLRQAGLDGSPQQAALAVQPWPIAFGLATLVVGPLADRFAPARLLASSSLLTISALALCIAALVAAVPDAAVIPLMAAGMGVYGCSQALAMGVASPTVARYFGRTHHGRIRGTVARATVIGTGAAPWLVAAAATTADDNFAWPFAACALLAVPLGLASLKLTKPTPPAPIKPTPPDPDEPDPPQPDV